MATLVIAEFSIKEQYVEQFKELLASSDGLEVTRSFDGYQRVESTQDPDNPGRLLAVSRWPSAEHYRKYLKFRQDSGLFDKLADWFSAELSIQYLNLLDA